MKSPGIVRVGGIEIDARCSPVIVVRYHDGQTGADFSRTSDMLVSLAKECRWVGMIQDTTALTTVLGPSERKLVIEAADRITPVMNRRAVGSAVIIRNPFVRGAVTAAKWFTKQEFPTQAFGTVQEGADWIVTRFREVGEPLPAATVEQLRRRLAEPPAA